MFSSALYILGLVAYFPIRLCREFFSKQVKSCESLTNIAINRIFITHAEGNETLGSKDRYYLMEFNPGDLVFKVQRKRVRLPDCKKTIPIYLGNLRISAFKYYFSHRFLEIKNKSLYFSALFLIKTFLLEKFSHYKLAHIISERIIRLDQKFRNSKSKPRLVFVTKEGHLWEKLLAAELRNLKSVEICYYAHSALTFPRIRKIASQIKNDHCKFYASFAFQLEALRLVMENSEIPMYEWPSIKDEMLNDLKKIKQDPVGKNSLVIIEGLIWEVIATFVHLAIYGAINDRFFWIKAHPRLNNQLIFLLDILGGRRVTIKKEYPKSINQEIWFRGTFGAFEAMSVFNSSRFVYFENKFMEDKDILLRAYTSDVNESNGIRTVEYRNHVFNP